MRGVRVYPGFTYGASLRETLPAIAISSGSEIFFGTRGSWGFGMKVNSRRHEIFHTSGRFGWDGGFGTSAYTNPAKGMIGIRLTQRMMDSPEPPKLFTDSWTLAYGAME